MLNGGRGKCCLNVKLENTDFGFYIYFLFHCPNGYLMITFIVLLPRFTMFTPFIGASRRLPLRS